jgi:hypothetical protein
MSVWFTDRAHVSMKERCAFRSWATKKLSSNAQRMPNSIQTAWQLCIYAYFAFMSFSWSSLLSDWILALAADMQTASTLFATLQFPAGVISLLFETSLSLLC